MASKKQHKKASLKTIPIIAKTHIEGYRIKNGKKKSMINITKNRIGNVETTKGTIGKKHINKKTVKRVKFLKDLVLKSNKKHLSMKYSPSILKKEDPSQKQSSASLKGQASHIIYPVQQK